MQKIFTLLSSCCLSLSLLAQEGIQTENTSGVEDLIKNVFLKGNCKNVSNITAIGNEELSIGTFKNGANIIGFNEGIILSTGDIDLAQGPNISNESSFSFDTESNDLDLSQLATGTLFDVTGVEFDFVPLDDKVAFRYVFASEEYCEFVGTSFNDVFGFFVSGPGINGTFANNAINVATIITLMGTEETVSINNINHLQNETFYVSNITTTDAQNCEISYTPTFQDLIDYDGFTIALTATIPVIPCERYHIRLTVGDVGDANLDSAVFLESKSFDLGEKVTMRAEVPGREAPIAYEGCVDGQFVFTRSSLSTLSEDCTVEYAISSGSEATNGSDFSEIPLRITIPAGDTSAVLPITIIDDILPEGMESIALELIYDCDCLEPAVSELIIDETIDLAANFEDIKVCSGQSFSIAPVIDGGVPPLDFLWETGASTEFLDGSITAPTQYTVTITDFCGRTTTATADLTVQDVPTATLMGIYDVCEISATGIPVELAGSPPWSITYRIDGVEQAPIEQIQTNPFFLPVSTAGTYEITTFRDAYCEGQSLGIARVAFRTFSVATTVVAPSCFNRADGSITITQLDAIPPFSIEWSTSTNDELALQDIGAGTYRLGIVDGNGCVYEETFELRATNNDRNACLPIYIPNIFSPNDDGVNDLFSVFLAEASGIENIVSFQVYNRWGTLLFEQRDFLPSNGNVGWKGDYEGNPSDAGIYVYQITVAFEDGSTQLLSGDVMLLR